jgi:hypothetical protein
MVSVPGVTHVTVTPRSGVVVLQPAAASAGIGGIIKNNKTELMNPTKIRRE